MYMSVSSAARKLDVCRMTVYRMCENGVLPYSRLRTNRNSRGPRAKILIDEKDLEKYIKSNRIMSNEELIEAADLKLLEMERAREERLRRMR